MSIIAKGDRGERGPGAGGVPAVLGFEAIAPTRDDRIWSCILS